MTSDEPLLSKKARRDAAVKQIEGALTRNDLINAAIEALDDASITLADTDRGTSIDVEYDSVDGSLRDVVTVVVDAVLRAQG